MNSSGQETLATQFAGWFVYYVSNLIFSRQDGISLDPGETHFSLAGPVAHQLPRTHPAVQSLLSQPARLASLYSLD